MKQTAHRTDSSIRPTGNMPSCRAEDEAVQSERRASSLAMPRCGNVTERKHYFEEGRRICSKLGGGFRGRVLAEDILKPVEEVNDNYEEQHNQQRQGVHETFGKCIGAWPELIDKYDLLKMLLEYKNDEKNFYYHGDHLGSAAYLTYHGGVIQTLNYLPYGEDWVEFNFFHPDDTTRLGIYRFNGKEKDYESGFHYYGARYYWSEVLTGWLSVDPMTDKYPSISPYNYCLWNPIKLVDPDGNEAMTNDDWYKSTTKNSNGDYSVFWSPENAQTISVNGETYTNIGSSYIHSTEQGVTFYEQNSVTAFFPYLPVKDLSLSDKGTDFLFGNEGVRLKPYNDSKGYATIGVGHLIAKRNVTEQDKRNWSGFTRSDAINLFQQDVQSFENGIKSSVNVNLTQYQYDAIVSFAFNIGMGNFKKSEFLMSLNNGNYNGNLMMNFHRPPEIVPRRQREVNLFNDATY